MILKKKKIVSNIRFKRIEFAGYGVCKRACCWAWDGEDCRGHSIKSACDKIYNSGIDRLKNHCYIYDY